MMLAFKESHSLAVHYCRLVWDVRSLSYLSQKACLGILRRAAARGKKLPEVLRLALEKQA